MDKLNNGGVRVIVGAIDLETALITYFDNSEHDLTGRAFPMEIPIPKSLPDVVNRIIALQYTSRIKLDEKFFDKIDRLNQADRVRRRLSCWQTARCEQTRTTGACWATGGSTASR